MLFLRRSVGDGVARVSGYCAFGFVVIGVRRGYVNVSVGFNIAVIRKSYKLGFFVNFLFLFEICID